jgi:hypothetical protein
MGKQDLGSINAESSIVINEKSPIDTAIKIFEVISLALMALPYCSIGLSMLLSSVPGKDYFILFAYGLFALLPTGIIALFVQLFRKLRKRPISTLSNIVLVSSIITTIFGVFGYMLIYAVAG